MSTNFPTSLDSFTNPTATQKLNNPSHSSQHTNENDAITAIETKVGVDSSAVATTIDYLLKNTASSDPGHKHTFSSLSNFTVSSPSANDILQYSGTTWQNKAGLFKFGGTGADGALTISSGTTTINLGGAAKLIKNYSSISITGTGVLNFSNPNANGTIVILKSAGNVTLTSSSAPMLDCSGLGASGGSGGAAGASHPGIVGNSGICALGVAPSGGSAPSGTTGGVAGTAIALVPNQTVLYRTFQWFVGAGASGGSSGQGASAGAGGNGGAGGGFLMIECGGAWNFTTANGISVAGIAGSNGSQGSSTSGQGAGGGGGGAGMCMVLYTSLTANSGTINVSGGGAGTGASAGGSGGANGGGGGGGSIVAGTNGGNYSAGTTAPNGGAGANGFSLVQQNTEFA